MQPLFSERNTLFLVKIAYIISFLIEKGQKCQQICSKQEKKIKRKRENKLCEIEKERNMKILE